MVISIRHPARHPIQTRSLLIRGARVVCFGGPQTARAATADSRALSNHDDTLNVRDDTDVLITDGRIAAIGTHLTEPQTCEVIQATGRVLVPGFVDAHTHLCWAGDRLDEWEQKRAGASYLDILRAGGGIMSTVRAVRQATEQELTAQLARRLEIALRHGTTSLEIKSGYGLDVTSELKMLRAIHAASRDWPGHITITALLGHAINADQPNFIDRTIGETLDAVHAEFPGIAIDAFCEKAAWSLDDATRLLERARSLGHPVRIHADQFNSLGMVERAIKLGALCVDHLEASTLEDLDQLAASSTFAGLLPCAGFHVDGRYASGRRLLDAGASVYIATNANPGSAPCFSMPMAIALGVRGCGLSPTEAIVAATAQPARLLGLNDRGRIDVGLRADLVLLQHTDPRALAYEFGHNPVEFVVCGGQIVHQALA